MEDHLLLRGKVKNYIRWIHHGEDFEYDSVGVGDGGDDEDDGFDDDITKMPQDVANAFFMDNLSDEPTRRGPFRENMFYKMLNDSKQELYLGCEKLSQLSFLVKLYHLKIMNQWSYKSIDMLLDLFKCALLANAKVPKSHYRAIK